MDGTECLSVIIEVLDVYEDLNSGYHRELSAFEEMHQVRTKGATGSF